MFDTKLRSRLTSATQSIVTAAYWATPIKARRAPRSEPEYLAALIANSTLPLARAWSWLLAPANLQVTITSIFAHQRPRVRFPYEGGAADGLEGCELADWVIVHDHDARRRRAVLVQTKVNSKAVRGAQKRLYEQWPVFQFGPSAISATPPPYNIKPNDEGCRYGVMHSPPARIGCEWTVDRVGGGSTQLATFLVGMLEAGTFGTFGPARSATINGTDDWSQLVDRLLKMSVANVASLKGYLPHGFPRRWSRTLNLPAAAYLMFDGTRGGDGQLKLHPFGALAGPPSDLDLSGDQRGANVLYIQTRSAEEHDAGS